MRRSPIGNDESLESPIVLQHIGKNVFVLTSEVAVDQVVGAHHCPGMADVDADFEGQHVRLAHRALADHRVDFVPSALLVVHDVVLDIADHVLRLLALDTIANQRSGENWILAHVLERASVAGFASEVHTAAESHVVSLIAKFASDQRTVTAGRFWVPTRC